MRETRNLRIPGRYLFKTAMDVVLLGTLFFAFTQSESWLPTTWGFDTTMKIILHFFIVFFAFSLVLRFLAIGYRRRKHLPFDKKDNVTVGLNNIFVLFIFVYVLISLVSLFGVRVGEMLTSLSIGAAAIAILLKDFVADIISGILISFSNEIQIDDQVKIGTIRGRIIDINISKTALVNEEDDIVFLPNSKVFTSETINYSKRPIKKTVIEFEVHTGEFESIEEMENHLIDLMHAYEKDIAPESYLLQVVAIHKDFLSLRFQYQLNDYDRVLERKIKQKTERLIVKYTFKKVAGQPLNPS